MHGEDGQGFLVTKRYADTGFPQQRQIRDRGYDTILLNPLIPRCMSACVCFPDTNSVEGRPTSKDRTARSLSV